MMQVFQPTSISGNYTPPPNLTSSLIYAGDLYFDKIENEVWFAGSTWSDNASFIYQKLIDMTSPGVTLFGPINGSMDRFAELIVPDRSFIKIAKIMRSGSVEKAVIAANFYESVYYSTPNVSVTYPTLNIVDYSDVILSDPSLQLVDLYTYPRVIAGNFGVGNYLTYLQYYNQYYPAHTAHSDFSNGLEYVMGTSSYDPNMITDPEKIALTKTDNIYNNDCSYEMEELGNANPGYAPTQPTPLSYAHTPLEVYPSHTIYSISDIDVNDCIDNTAFKKSSPFEAATIRTVVNGLQIKLMCSTPAASYILYSSQGSMIEKGKLAGLISYFSLPYLASGTYIMEVHGENGVRIGVQKLGIH